MNFVLASDNNFVPFLSVTLVSLIENNKSNSEPLYIYILNDNISENNKDQIKSLADKDNIYLSFIETKNLEDINIPLLGLKRNLDDSLTTYARLFVASLLPEEIDRVIYLDCDILVLDSFKELWKMDLKDNYAAGVLDVSYTSTIESLGFKPDKYFNAGVLLINLEKWREDNVEKSFIKFMEDNQSRFYQHDQGILNHIFEDKIAVINPKFNLAGYFNILDYDLAMKFSAKKDKYYSREIIEDALNNPVVLHFCGKDKPWLIEDHPHRKTYEKYTNLSGFDKEKILKSINVPFMNKLFYKSFNNSFLKFLLKAYPNFILYNQLIKNANAKLIEDNKKASELAKNN